MILTLALQRWLTNVVTSLGSVPPRLVHDPNTVSGVTVLFVEWLLPISRLKAPS